MGYTTKLLQVALAEYGVTEVKGGRDNPSIIHYFNVLGYDGKKLHDETAWCSAYIGYCAKSAGLIHSVQLHARAWAKMGKPSKPVDPITKKSTDAHGNLGDICVFWRGANEWETIKGSDIKKGHVGIYIHETETHIYILGGNQRNQVSIRPYDAEKLLAVRTLEPEQQTFKLTGWHSGNS